MKKAIPQWMALIILTGACIQQTRAQSIIFDNGPYFNSVGTGSGGANESVLYTTTFGMSTIGFGHQSTAFNRVADDFTIADCMWRIDSVVFFGYQTGSTITSTFTAVNFRIWDGIPDAPGSNIVFGDTTTNRMIATSFSGTFRVTETTTGNSTRPIMRNVCNAGSIYLPAGTYWLDWQSSGSLASGPWACPRTPVNLAITGNGRQRIGQVWNNLVDGGTGTPAQGLPFIIYGEVFTLTADAGMDADYCSGQLVGLGGAPSGSGGFGSLTYAWYASPNINDSTLANPTLTVNSSGSYVLTVSDTAGCVALDTVVINALPLPVASITPAGPVSFCPGGQATLTAGAGMGYEFLWSTSDTTSTINITTAGWVMLNVTDSAGCTDNDSVNVSINPSPIASITPAGPVGFCPGGQATLTASAGIGYEFLWSTSDTTSTINVTTAGWVVLNVTDSAGCTDNDSVEVIVNPAPINTVNQAGSSLTANQAGASYQWVDCNNSFSPIPGATAQNYTATANGSYAVIIDLGGCIDTSACQTVFDVGIENMVSENIHIYPNPATDFLQIVCSVKLEDIRFEVINLQGQIVTFSDAITLQPGEKFVLDISILEKGVYVLRVNNSSTIFMKN